MATTDTFADLPQLDTTLPDAPTYNPQLPTGGFQSASTDPNYVAQNPYGQGSHEYDVYQAYLNNLGRAPDQPGFQHYLDLYNQGWNTDRINQDIMGSSEAQTYGRARAEVNPQIDAQIQQFYNDIATQRQQASSQMGALGSKYKGIFGELAFGNTEQQTALDQQLQQMLDDYGIQSGRLTEQYTPALLAARQAALRNGFTDASTIAAERIAAGFKPISQGLADLAIKTQTGRQGIQQKKQALQEKYLFSRQQNVEEEQSQAQAIRDALALYTTQQLQGVSAAQASRPQQIMARGGALQDQYRQFQLNKQIGDIEAQKLQEQIREFNEKLAQAKKVNSALA